MLSPRTSGVTGALPYNPFQYCLLAACTAVAWAFAIELNLTVCLTFHKRTGIYFWSLLISSWGCVLHALGFILKFLVGTNWLVDLAFINIGWVMMVSGQSFVLWSRLNLVVRNKVILNTVLAAIIIDGLAFHTPIFVFIYGANAPRSRWVTRFNTMERVQLMGFSIQESIIGTIYIICTFRLLGAVYYQRTRQAMMQLLIVNFICIGMDIILVGLEFSNNYVSEASIKPLVYAIKLKLEFAVYSQLVGFTKATFEERREVDTATNSVDGGDPHYNQQYNSPADFFKNIPKVLRKPVAPSHPTIHTHPEQLLAITRPVINRNLSSSQLELSPATFAAALTSEGGRDIKMEEEKMRKSRLNEVSPDSGTTLVNRSKTRSRDRRSESSIPTSEKKVAVPHNHEP
ncbi:hypothetical protein ACLMJK_009470 [Lecanora helva]